LAPLECGGYDSRGAALSARRRWWLEWQCHDIGSLIFRREHDRSLSHRRWRRAVADDEQSLRLILSRVCRKVHQSKLGHSRFRITTEGSELGHYPSTKIGLVANYSFERAFNMRAGVRSASSC
jgi:hypothetical protein